MTESPISADTAPLGEPSIAERELADQARMLLAEDRAALLTEGQQEALVRSWRWGRQVEQDSKLRGTRAGRQAMAAGRADLDVLMKSLEGLVWKIVEENSRQRMGVRWVASEREDLMSEGRLAMLEALAVWNPDRNVAVAKWVAWSVRNCLNNLSFEPGGGVVPKEWRKVAKVAHGVMSELGADRGDMVSVRIDDIVADRFVTQTSEKIRVQQPELAEGEIAEMAHDRLSRSSINRALGELGDIMAVAGGALSLDAPVGPDAEETLLDMVADEDRSESGSVDLELLDALLQGLPDDEIAVIRSRWARTRVTYAELAEEHGIEQSEARRIVKMSKARIEAPHFQWCRLGPDVSSQFTKAARGRPAGVGHLGSGVHNRVARSRQHN